MCNSELFPLIEEYQSGNMSHFEILYKVFEKLLFYYSKKLDYDDALQELNVFLVELLHQLSLDKFCIDESYGLKRYISASIKHKYIALSKLHQAYNSLFVEYCEQISFSDSDFEESLFLSDGLLLLSVRQRQIIVRKYICGYSDFEIAENLHISRQAVNRLKIRGLLILKKYFEEK